MRETVTQFIDRGRALTMYKELLRVEAPGGPLSIVRKSPLQEPRAAIMLVHGFAQNRYSWHLSQRSLVNYLVDGGYDVFNAELRGHGRSGQLGSRPPKSFYEYAFEDLPALVRAALSASNRERLFIMGHSLGAGVTFAAAPQLQKNIQGIVSLAGVFHYGRGVPIIRAIGYPARALLQTGIPSRFTFSSRVIAKTLLRVPLAQKMFELAHLLPWEHDSFEPDVLNEYLRSSFDRTSFEIVDDIFAWMKHDHFGGARDLAAAFHALKLPLLVVSADHDRLNAPEGVKPAYEGSASPDKTYLELSPSTAGAHYGHADLILGKHAPQFFWPTLRAWFDTRAGE